MVFDKVSHNKICVLIEAVKNAIEQATEINKNDLKDIAGYEINNAKVASLLTCKDKYISLVEADSTNGDRWYYIIFKGDDMTWTGVQCKDREKAIKDFKEKANMMMEWLNE